jgi:hypothetical protein
LPLLGVPRDFSPQRIRLNPHQHSFSPVALGGATRDTALS